MSQKMSTMNIYLFETSDISALLWISFLCNSINIFLSSFKLHYVWLFELRTFKTADELVKNSLRPTSTVYSIWMSEWNGYALRRPAANTYAQRWWWRWRWNAVTTRPSDHHFYGLKGRREREKWKGGSLKNYMLLNWNFRLKAEAKHETGRGYRNIETTSQDTNSRMVVYYYLWLYYSGHWPRAIFSLFRTIFTHNLPRLINKWIAITHCVYAALLSAPLFANALCQFILEKF